MKVVAEFVIYRKLLKPNTKLMTLPQLLCLMYWFIKCFGHKNKQKVKANIYKQIVAAAHSDRQKGKQTDRSCNEIMYSQSIDHSCTCWINIIKDVSCKVTFIICLIWFRGQIWFNKKKERPTAMEKSNTVFLYISFE